LFKHLLKFQKFRYNKTWQQKREKNLLNWFVLNAKKLITSRKNQKEQQVPERN